MPIRKNWFPMNLKGGFHWARISSREPSAYCTHRRRNIEQIHNEDNKHIFPKCGKCKIFRTINWNWICWEDKLRLISRNALVYTLVSDLKPQNIKICSNTILAVVSYWCGTLHSVLRKEQDLKVPENRVLKLTCGFHMKKVKGERRNCIMKRNT